MTKLKVLFLSLTCFLATTAEATEKVAPKYNYHYNFKAEDSAKVPGCLTDLGCNQDETCVSVNQIKSICVKTCKTTAQACDGSFRCLASSAHGPKKVCQKACASDSDCDSPYTCETVKNNKVCQVRE